MLTFNVVSHFDILLRGESRVDHDGYRLFPPFMSDIIRWRNAQHENRRGGWTSCLLLQSFCTAADDSFVGRFLHIWFPKTGNISSKLDQTLKCLEILFLLTKRQQQNVHGTALYRSFVRAW